MDASRVQRGELVAILGGALVALGVFLGWYHLQNHRATLNGHAGEATLSAWQAHPLLRWLLLLAAIAPVILAYIIARNHTLSWPRGQMTSVVAIIAFGLIGYNGVIGRPGDPRSLIGLRYGWAVALLGSILMLFGSVMRQNESEIKRKPPGTI